MIIIYTLFSFQHLLIAMVPELLRKLKTFNHASYLQQYSCNTFVYALYILEKTQLSNN